MGGSASGRLADHCEPAAFSVLSVFSLSDWYTARRLNETVYGFKTLVDPDTRPHPGRPSRRAICGRCNQSLRPRDTPRAHRRRSKIDDVHIPDGDFGYWLHGLAFDAEEHDDSTIHYHLSELRHGPSGSDADCACQFFYDCKGAAGGSSQKPATSVCSAPIATCRALRFRSLARAARGIGIA